MVMELLPVWLFLSYEKGSRPMQRSQKSAGSKAGCRESLQSSELYSDLKIGIGIP
jgi:hypothetical protein